MNCPGNKMGALQEKCNGIHTLDSHTKRNYKWLKHFNAKKQAKREQKALAQTAR